MLLEGNHSDRLRRYLQDKAPALFGLVDVRQLYELDENGWEFVPYKADIKIGRVYFTHDTGTSGRYTTQRAMDAYQHSVVIGHHHRIELRVEGDAVGGRQIAAQFGWLGDVDQVDYMHKIKARREWSLGFGTGHHDTKTGLIYLQAHPIVDYTCCVDGAVYAN